MRIVKNTKYVLVCFFVLMSEMIFGKYLEVGGIVPMLSFCLCLATAMIEDEPRYVICQAIVLGVLLDAFSGRAVGTYTITFLLSSFATYLVRDNLFSSAILLMICDVFVMTLFSTFVFWLFNVWNVGTGFVWMLTGVALPQALYNVIISLIFYFFLRKIYRKRR